MTNLPEMIPLTDADLDAVAGGQAVAAGGLVNIALSDINVDVLRNARFDIDVDIPVTIRNVANNNNIAVGALINVLGGPSAILQRQTQ
ncbi:MAG: hypothetical protein ACJ8E1_15035 [Xanthobacteraceae bacterium]